MSASVGSPAGSVLRFGTLTFSLLVHLGLAWWLVVVNLAGHSASQAASPAISIELVRLVPEQKLAPEEIKEQVKVHPKSVKGEIPKVREARPLDRRDVSGPPVHDISTGSDEWVMPVEGAPDPVLSSRRAPSGYADKVKGLVVANMQYPADALYEAPRRYKGDLRLLQQQCRIPYEITVDRNGNVLSYKFERCGNGKLDAAAEEALKKTGPFPPPPDQDSENLVIYGVQIFRTK
ncbi:MAG: TonB family protein [Rhodocyclaceae bacterium]|nr:TonB family protein [Rhodocyclaceae bacterium]